MKNLKTGQFFGVTNQLVRLNNLTLTDTEYTHEKVDWHYHENAYFTFILDGKIIEGNKKEIYQCTAGSLLFHNWQESHYNIKPKGFTRGFHIELEPCWFKQYDIDTDTIQGSINIKDPEIKLQMYRIFRESKLADDSNKLVVDGLLTELFGLLTYSAKSTEDKKPHWVTALKDKLNDIDNYDFTLSSLATELNIHPVHLSRQFSKHFNCHLGEYIRKVKIQRSLSLISNKELSLTDIAFKCGFADQSHFIRSFKMLNQVTPARYRKLLQK